MFKEAACVLTCLCCIIQVAFVPCVLGSVMQSTGAGGSSILVKILVQRTINSDTNPIKTQGPEGPTTTQGPDGCDDVSPNVQLTAPVATSLVAKWAPDWEVCSDTTGYQVTLYDGDRVHVRTETTTKTHFVFPDLDPAATYVVEVRAMSGADIVDLAASAAQTTLDGVSAGCCPYPAIDVFPGNAVVCASVQLIQPADNEQGNYECHSSHSDPTIKSHLYFYKTTNLPFEDVLDYLRLFDYTEELLVNAIYKNGTWMWTMFVDFPSPWPIDLDLLTGVPAGGDGPDEYTMLYLDPAKDFGFSPAKYGHNFGGMLCMTELDRYF